MKIFLTIRNNWKKVLLASSMFGYGACHVKSEYEISQHMRSVCNSVSCSGVKVDKPKSTLVVLNPIANKKNAEKLFKKYCEPILHLAGYSIDIRQTNYVGHAKSLIESLKVLPDAIVVAGGDGTSSEVLTGLMRRTEKPCPIAIIPLGSANETASKYVKFNTQGSKLEHVRSLTSSILLMVQGRTQNENVIKYCVVNSSNANNVQNNLKPIYGLNRFSWGLLRDIESMKDKYWYFGNLRYHVAALFNSFSTNLNWKFSTNFVYTPPCPGCRECTKQNDKPNFISIFKKVLLIKEAEATEVGARCDVKNESCNSQIKGKIEANQLNITCKQNNDAFYELETKCVDSLNPGLRFIKNILNITRNNISPSLTLRSRTIELIPDSIINKSYHYSIDGEEYDVRPIKIAILPKAIKIFS